MTIDPKWFAREQWTLIEAAQICAGENPYQGGAATDSPHKVAENITDPQRRELFSELYARSKDAINSASLERGEKPRTGYVGNTRVIPAKYLAWAIDTLPIELADRIDKASLSCVFGEKQALHSDDTFLETELGYTIVGAARAVSDKYDANERALGERIVLAVRAGELPLVDPETRIPYGVLPREIADFRDRIRTVDLNAWFSRVDVEYVLGADASQNCAAPNRKGGFTKNRIMGAFMVRPDADENIVYWERKLRDPPQWLKPARLTSGGQGIAALWDPVGVACALLDRKAMNLARLDSAMQSNFAERLEEWREATVDRR